MPWTEEMGCTTLGNDPASKMLPPPSPVSHTTQYSHPYMVPSHAEWWLPRGTNQIWQSHAAWLPIPGGKRLCHSTLAFWITSSQNPELLHKKSCYSKTMMLEESHEEVTWTSPTLRKGKDAIPLPSYTSFHLYKSSQLRLQVLGPQTWPPHSAMSEFPTLKPKTEKK